MQIELTALPLLRTGQVQVRDFTLQDMQAYARENMAVQAAEIAALKAKLEVDPAHSYDGIDCRDETIKMQDAAMGQLIAEIAALREAGQQALDALQACMDSGLGMADKINYASRATIALRQAIAQAVQPS